MQKGWLVREQDNLGAPFPAPVDLVYGVTAAEAVKTGERIIEYDHFPITASVLLKLRKEEGERERAPVPRAERVPEARPVRRRCGVTDIHGVLVDHDLVTRAWRSAPVGMSWGGDPKPCVDTLEIAVDALAISLDDLLCVRIE